MNPSGKFVWHDLTVEDAEKIRDFYSLVLNWEWTAQDMGGYNDYNMIHPKTREVVAGICHKRGPNQQLPSQWLNYVAVNNLQQSLQHCKTLGGKVIDGPKTMGQSTFAIIQDPAGAYLALFEEQSTA